MSCVIYLYQNAVCIETGCCLPDVQTKVAGEALCFALNLVNTTFKQVDNEKNQREACNIFVWNTQSI